MKFISIPQTAERYGVARQTVWRWIKERPDFPKPVRFSSGCTRLAVADLDAYDASKAEAAA